MKLEDMSFMDYMQAEYGWKEKQKGAGIMKMVIDIPEDLYEGIERRDGALETKYVCDELMKAVDNGIPLPKGHGQIGDLDALREEVSSWGMNDYEPSDFVDAIDEADTIIEADTAESEG